MLRAILIAALSAGVLVSAAARSTQNPLTGRVVADDSGDPIANARVAITASGASTRLAITDANGRFTTTAAAPFTVAALKSGYVRREMTVRSPADQIELRLPRAAVITGRVVNRLGEAVPNALVFAERPPEGDRRGTGIARTDTDDRGEFRIAGLAAGRAVVGAMTASETTRVGYGGRPTVAYFPGVASASDAEVIELRAGDEHADVDFMVDADQIGFGGVFFAAPLQPRAAPAGRATGAIRGRVSSVDGRVLPNASVRLYPSIGPPIAMRTTRTDLQGRFEFADVPAGKFRIAALKAGYTAAKPADRVLPDLPVAGAGPSVELAEGQAVDRVDIQLARLGIVAGIVYDELGDPVQGAAVQLLRVRYERGRRRLAPASNTRPTDDRGAWRIFGVPPGRYVVTAAVGAVQSAPLPGYARSYFPGTADPGSAQFVSVAASQDVVGVDFALEPAQTARIAGNIIDSAGRPTMAGTLQLRATGSGGVASVPLGATVGRDGTFEFANVAPGQYLIYADRGRQSGGGEGEFAAVPVAVDGVDVTGLEIQTSAGSTIAGRFTFETADPDKRPPRGTLELSPVPVDLETAPSNIAHADIREDWTFLIKGVNGMRRIEMTQLPVDWTLREVRANGLDVTDRPLPFGRARQALSNVEVVLTDRVNAVAGVTQDADGGPVAGAHVIVVPMDRDARYAGSRFLRHAASLADGTFSVSGLPPGLYYAAAVRSLPEGGDAWQDPVFLEALEAGAARITFVGDGQRETVALRVR